MILVGLAEGSLALGVFMQLPATTHAHRCRTLSAHLCVSEGDDAPVSSVPSSECARSPWPSPPFTSPFALQQPALLRFHVLHRGPDLCRGPGLCRTCPPGPSGAAVRRLPGVVRATTAGCCIAAC